MYAEDRVLVGVVKRLSDLQRAREYGGYHIPLSNWRGEDIEYLAIFLNGRLRKQQAQSGQNSAVARRQWQDDGGKGAVCYYAEVYGYELAYRYQILPAEADHPRAREVYCWLKLGPLQERIPPIVNAAGQRFSFIHTNWEHFTHARQISQLYLNKARTLARSA